ncbi:hypothetical protein GF378_03155 [Candidatus Pacearchaeota archaeon]|nr:hypothetical protein [Candidatus Pacearchaeota archaeon]
MKENFKKKVLENGLTILFEKRDLPIASMAIAVKNGAINESLEEKGISHFIEHMLYKGTSTRTNKEIAEEIEKNGGELNGFTSELVTAYWCKMPSNHLNVGLEVLADLVKNPLFDEKEIEKERNVIFEEIKMYHDNPKMHAFHEIEKNLFSGSLSVSILGTKNTMKSLDKEKLVKRFERTYTPNNMIVCIVGDADFNEIVKFAQKNFGIKKGSVPKQKFGFKNSSRIETRKGIDQANILFAYHVPLLKNKKSYAARVLSTMIAEGMSSRLFSEIREKRNLAYAVKGDSDINNSFAFNYIYVGTTKDKVKKVKELILNEFKDISENLVEDELNQVKEQIKGNHRIGLEDSQQQMVNLLYAETNAKAELVYDFEENISNVRLEDVKEIAKKAYKEYSFFALVPE